MGKWRRTIGKKKLVDYESRERGDIRGDIEKLERRVLILRRVGEKPRKKKRILKKRNSDFW